MAFKMKGWSGSPMKQMVYDCPECGAEFETFAQLGQHMQSHFSGDPSAGPGRNPGGDPTHVSTDDNTGGRGRDWRQMLGLRDD
jgi:hypothetical protein